MKNLCIYILMTISIHSISACTSKAAQSVNTEYQDPTQDKRSETIQLFDRVALVDDADGSVNLRDAEGFKSHIVNQLPNGTFVSAFCEDMTSNPNFCYILSENNQHGFIHKSRLNFLNQNQNFINIPITAHKNNFSFTAQDYNIKGSINLKLTPINVSKIIESELPICSTTYKGICSYGLDSWQANNDEKYYQFSNITLEINNKIISIPNNELADMFIPKYHITDNEMISRMKVYWNPTINHIYLLFVLADGGLMYSSVFELDNNNFLKRSTWLEVI